MTDDTRASGTRLTSIDVIRGVVMVLMAIDHVRVYAGVPAGGQEPAIFFTRWVTHFCAPVFVFLAGTSAFFYGRARDSRTENRSELRTSLSWFLLTRGLLLVVLELTVIRYSWTFNLGFSQFMLAGVIWMIGWCMVLMAVISRLPPIAAGVLGLAIIVFQNVFGRLGLEFIYPAGADDGPFGMAVLYVIVPWIGVMAAGYGFGAILNKDARVRTRWCLGIGLAAIAVFLAGGLLTNAPNQLDEAPPALFRLLNQQKYPASLLFLCMTLGPAIALMPLAERATGAIGRFFTTFGRVPFFYYLLHIPLIHAAALVVNRIRTGAVHHEWYSTAPFAGVPRAGRWELWTLYLVFAIVVAVLYLLCRWYAALKARSRAGWLRYI